ncbi:MAG TPA: hypothetical protein VFW73_05220 [Lacipirellulaceae bacterium]|nr:hypothetical protein [Lacipirellulaceae bacterium]
MSPITDPPPDPAADEIVAYLDGELPAADCRRVENRLATDDEFRQQMHELDRTWEALDALPLPTVDDAFARTTIELACVAAESDLGEQTSSAREAQRKRSRRWMIAGVSAVVVGFLAGWAFIPNRNVALLTDLPAIQQYHALQYVDGLEFLRRLGSQLPLDQWVRDNAAFQRNLDELTNANSSSIDTRRQWVQSLQPEQKAELADRTREFNDLTPSPGEQQHMRQVMEDIRTAPDGAKLQATLVAYGIWLSRHSAAQQEELRTNFARLSPTEQAAEVEKLVRREQFQSWHHLSARDAKALRDEVLRIADEKRPEFKKRLEQHPRLAQRVNRPRGPEQQALGILGMDLFNKDTGDKTAARLVGKLSPEAQDHWSRLARGPRDLRKLQLFVWIRDAMHPKLEPQDLEEFFATSDALTTEDRQRLLDKQRPEMEDELKRKYMSSELGIDNPQLLREFSEPRHFQRDSPASPGREPFGQDRFFGPGASGGPPPGGRPNGRRPDRQLRPPAKPPQPSPDNKQEAI